MSATSSGEHSLKDARLEPSGNEAATPTPRPDITGALDKLQETGSLPESTHADNIPSLDKPRCRNTVRDLYLLVQLPPLELARTITSILTIRPVPCRFA